jgi:hypothetical protein
MTFTLTNTATPTTHLGDNGTLLSGALDRSILAWEYSHVDNNHSILYECRGHTGGVESISLNATGDRFASGSADASIKIWTTIIPTVSDHIEDVTETRKKRKTVKEDRILKVRDSTHSGVKPVFGCPGFEQFSNFFDITFTRHLSLLSTHTLDPFRLSPLAPHQQIPFTVVDGTTLFASGTLRTASTSQPRCELHTAG